MEELNYGDAVEDCQFGSTKTCFITTDWPSFSSYVQHRERDRERWGGRERAEECVYFRADEKRGVSDGGQWWQCPKRRGKQAT